MEIWRMPYGISVWHICLIFLHPLFSIAKHLWAKHYVLYHSYQSKSSKCLLFYGECQVFQLLEKLSEPFWVFWSVALPYGAVLTYFYYVFPNWEENNASDTMFFSQYGTVVWHTQLALLLQTPNLQLSLETICCQYCFPCLATLFLFVLCKLLSKKDIFHADHKGSPYTACLARMTSVISAIHPSDSSDLLFPHTPCHFANLMIDSDITWCSETSLTPAVPWITCKEPCANEVL